MPVNLQVYCLSACAAGSRGTGGLACRFPNYCHDVASYWKMLMDGTNCVVEIPYSRWKAEYVFSPDSSKRPESLD